MIVSILITLCELDVDNESVLRIRRADLARRDPRDEFILAHPGKRMAAEGSASIQDLNLRSADQQCRGRARNST